MRRVPVRMTATVASLAAAGLALGLAFGPAGAVASESGAAALYAQAVRHANAEGVPRDMARAARLYCQAARDGESRAMFALAWMYLNGRGAAQDDAQGVAWMKAAAAAGHETAPNVLGKLDGITPAGTRRCPVEEPALAAAGSRLPLRPPPEIGRLATAIAAEYGLEPELVLAVIAVESAWRPDVVSHANAQGLMQLIPETAARFGVRDPFDPADNIRGGTRYLRWLLALFEGDVTKTLAAYNAGEKAVLKYGGVPPYEETQHYVVKIRRYYQATHHPYEATALESRRTVQVAQTN